MIFEAIAIATVLKTGVHGGYTKMQEPTQICFYVEDGADQVTYFVTDEEIELMRRCVMSEAGGECYEAQEAVATTILNRVFCPDKFGNSIDAVITAPGQFSCHDNGEPTVSVMMAVHNALQYYGGPCQMLPSQVYYFRSNYYHEFALDYARFGNLYFSVPKDACVN